MLDVNSSSEIVSSASQNGTPGSAAPASTPQTAGSSLQSAQEHGTGIRRAQAGQVVPPPEQLLDKPAKPSLLTAEILQASIDNKGDKTASASPAAPEAEAAKENGEAGTGDSGGKTDETSAESRDVKDPRQLTEADLSRIRQLSLQDARVRLNEETHVRIAGQYAGNPSYEFETGPDNRDYAISGEVNFNSTPVAGNPEATIRKLSIVKKAALAPAEPSSQDRATATKASQGITLAQTRLRLDQAQEQAREAKQNEAAAGNDHPDDTSATDSTNSDGTDSTSKATPAPDSRPQAAPVNPQTGKSVAAFTAAAELGSGLHIGPVAVEIA